MSTGSSFPKTDGAQIRPRLHLRRGEERIQAWKREKGYIIILHAMKAHSSLQIMRFRLLESAGLRKLTVGLGAAADASRGPGEVSNGNDEEAVTVVGKTGEGIVPSGKCSKEAEETTSLLDGGVRIITDGHQVGDSQQQEGQIQEEEQQEEGHGGAKGAEEQDRGEDEPSHQEETQRVIEGRGALCNEAVFNIEAWSQDNSKGDPETSIRRERCGTKSVSDCHFPTPENEKESA